MVGLVFRCVELGECRLRLLRPSRSVIDGAIVRLTLSLVNVSQGLGLDIGVDCGGLVS